MDISLHLAGQIATFFCPSAVLLPFFLKKCRQQSAAFVCQNARRNLRPVVARRRLKKLYAVFHRAAFRICRTVHQPLNPHHRQRRRAHRTRLQRYVKRAVPKPFLLQRNRPDAHRHRLRVRQRVQPVFGSVMRCRQNAPVRRRQHRPDRNFVFGIRPLRLFQRQPHIIFIVFRH